MPEKASALPPSGAGKTDAFSFVSHGGGSTPDRGTVLLSGHGDGSSG